MRFYVNWQYNTLTFCLQNGGDVGRSETVDANAFLFGSVAGNDLDIGPRNTEYFCQKSDKLIVGRAIDRRRLQSYLELVADQTNYLAA